MVLRLRDVSRARAGADGYPDGENRGETGFRARAGADGSEDKVLLTKKNVEEEESDRIETVTAAIMARARARYGVKGAPTGRWGRRAMRQRHCP